MKQLLFIITFAFVFPLSSHGDEGMWTLVDLPEEVYDIMVAEGYTMPYDALYRADDAIYKAVVNFSDYCTGVVVSPEGLVFTNHHCGFEAIRSHSTVEHDYLKDGFCAQSNAEELPCEDLFVAFLIAQKEVTDIVEQYNFRTLSEEQQEAVLEIIEDNENRHLHAIHPTLRAELKPYYEGNRYYVDVYEVFHDVRLVFTVPKSMGKYGGETDNWMWPRQTCDFSVFRIYADKTTNGAAPYSADNVPYHPTVYATVTTDGYNEGDFAMTMGYPGGTERYLSSFGIREMRDAENTIRWQAREVKQEVMLRHMKEDEAVRIKYDSKFANSANYWKNAIGMNKCIDSLDIITLKEQHEQAIQAYVDSTGYLRDALSFSLLDSLYQQRYAATRALVLYSETFNSDELTGRARSYATGGMPLHKDKGKKGKEYYVYEDNSDTYDLDTDKEILAALLKHYLNTADTLYLPAFCTTLSTYGGDCTRFVDDLYSQSVLMKTGEKIYDNKALRDDKGVAYGLDLAELRFQIISDYLESTYELEEQERLLCAAKVRMEEDKPHYSDANFTLRLSYGQVGGYDQYGHPSGYYTSAQSIVDKFQQAANNEEYFAEDIFHTLLAGNDYGQYTDSTTGTLNLCFLTNNDITGGNSGSPVFNAKNELLGLAFDGNWESLSADIFYDQRLARCICVDIRYMLFLMDKWGHAERLLRELGVAE